MSTSRDHMSLAGRVAVVTGGSRGIGRAIVETLSERGASVAIAFREREEPARELEAAIITRGGRAWAGQCDVADETAVIAFFEQAVSTLGAVDILVNNAGITRDAHIALLSKARWDEVLGVNLSGAYHAVRAVVSGMLMRGWGRIINVSSPSARMPLPGQTSYAASKAGLEGFTRALSRDLAAKGVLVNAVAPGLIDTELLDSMPRAAREAHLKMVPAGRPGTAGGGSIGGGLSRVRRRELCHGTGYRCRRRTLVSDTPTSDELTALKGELKQAIVRGLRLPITPEEIGDSTSLFGEGLGLDSIDVLELVLELERSFGVKIRDEQTGMDALRSVDTMADFVIRYRAAKPS